MNFVTRLSILLLCFATVVPAGAKDKPAQSNVVDQGTFTILVGGRRIGEETFVIKQLDGLNEISSELRVEPEMKKVSQSYLLKVAPDGSLIHYEWHEFIPEKAQSQVDPSEEFIALRYTGVDGKENVQPFLLSKGTAILDDFFFSQREVLLWRYLATTCKVEPAKGGCALPKTGFGTLLPRQRTSVLTTVEYVGRDKVTYKGQERELDHFRMESEGPTWDLWVNSDHKVLRLVIAENSTEVLRD